MPRRHRLGTGGLAYHVLNRRIGRLPLFEKPADYLAFEKILKEAHDNTGVRIPKAVMKRLPTLYPERMTNGADLEREAPLGS